MKKTIALLVAGTLAGLAIAYAQQALQPAAVNGCMYNSGTTTLSNGQSNVFACDVNGKLITN